MLCQCNVTAVDNGFGPVLGGIWFITVIEFLLWGSFLLVMYHSCYSECCVAHGNRVWLNIIITGSKRHLNFFSSIEKKTVNVLAFFQLTA